jgi:hypothetical protein
MGRVAVVFDEGAVAPGELLVALDRHPDPVFLVGGDAHGRAFVPLLRSAGTVVELTGDAERDTTAVRAAAPTGIVAFGEWSLPVAAGLAARLGLPFHRPETARALTDKYVQRERLRAAGVDSTGYRLLRTPSEWEAIPAQLDLPVVVKPARGQGSRNTYLVRDRVQGRLLIERLLDPADPVREERLIVEQYLDGAAVGGFGDYVSVESLCAGEVVRHLGITGKLPLVPPFRETGQFVPDALPPPLRRAVAGVAERALRALGVRHGITHTEIKLTAAGPRVIEVNGRIGGYIAELYRRWSGIDLVAVAIDAALGEPVELPRGSGERTVLQYYNQPPLGATALLAVDGVPALRRDPRVLGYTQRVKPGAALPGDVRSFDLDILTVQAQSPEGVLPVLDECLPNLVFTFATPGGELRIDGAGLRAHNASAPVRLP